MLNCPRIPKRWTESIVIGYDEVCQFISGLIVQHVRFRKKTCVLAFDGFIGAEWESIVLKVRDLLKKWNLSTKTIDITSYYKQPAEIEEMIKPYLTNDSDFGFVFKGKLSDFLDTTCFEALKSKIKSYKRKKFVGELPNVMVCYGPGAAVPSLRALYDIVLYVDITREALFKRSEKKPVFPLGARADTLPVHLNLRRLYYVDYCVLNKHKKYLLKYMDWYIEGSVTKNLKLFPKNVYDGILSMFAQYPFRLKPIYIPGVWGGQEIKKIRKLPESMPNCSFALEVIPHCQSIMIKVGETILDIPFYNFVWNQPLRILGRKSIEKFGNNFPITLNYDDTCQGGHLAIQVHPNGSYLGKNFNEWMRRDESYYVVKTYPGAKTYHGLKEETDLEKLRRLCKQAEKKRIPFNQDSYVNSWPSKVGDLFLIPAGTIHASGRNQLVLEIDTDPSKTGAEYTFHLYDYLRADLDGSLRAIHLNHSFNVIRPYRRTRWVAQHLKQSPRLIRSGKNWAEYLLGKRNDMYYKVHRLEFKEKIDDDTRGKFHILTLAEGDSVVIRSQKHPEREFKLNYTETAIVPACVGAYSIINLKNSFCKLTKALLK